MYAVKKAIYGSNPEELERLLKSSEDRLQEDEEGYLPIHWASQWGDFECAKTILKFDNCVNICGSGSRPPLVLAVASGDLDTIHYLLKKGANLDPVEEPNGPLFWANQEENLDALKMLLDHGAKVNQTNQEGDTVLMQAAMIGNIEVVKLLLARGADHTISNSCGDTAVDVAISWGHDEIVKLLEKL